MKIMCAQGAVLLSALLSGALVMMPAAAEESKMPLRPSYAAGAGGAQREALSGTILRNYFAVQTAGSAVIRSEEELSERFGLAAFMGPDGEPTQVDFSTELVLGVVLEDSADEEEVHLEALYLEGGALHVDYTVRVGERGRSYTIRPLLLLKVERSQVPDRIIFTQVE
ncbi:MAG: hypothetical protein IJ228_09655 [Succinivibrio sp.]|nr:hypothetical protein [Succinivibrio sp.]